MCVSWVPTSVKVAETVLGLPMAAGPAGPVIEAITGARLFTTRFRVSKSDLGFAAPFVVPLSVTVTLTAKVSDGVRLGLSSRYWCVAVQEVAPAGTVWGAPSPQSNVQVWV